MKNIIIISFLALFTFCGALEINAQGAGLKCGQDINSQQGSQELQEQTQQATQNAGEEQQIRTEEQAMVGESFMEAQEKAGNISQAREMVQLRSQELQEETQNINNIGKEILGNQNQVREAVYGLMLVEELDGSIGPRVAQIAQEINSSMVTTIVNEDKIQTRSAIARFFMGGEQKAAQELKEITSQNQGKVEELKQLKNSCLLCQEDFKTFLEEQIQNIEQEQVRLQTLAQKEENKLGLFGWVRNLFKFGR